MVYERIRKNNISQILSLAPMRMLTAIDEKNTFAIGAKSDEGKTEGILIYGFTGPEKAGIFWIYVNERIRGEGAGDGLMNEFFRRIAEKQIREVTVEIPDDDKSLFTQSYFNRFGFRFERNVTYEIFRNAGVLKEIYSLGSVRPVKGVLPASSVSEKVISDYLSKPGRENAKKILKDNIASINWDVSSIYSKNRQDIEGLLLIRDELGGLIEPVILETGMNFIETASRLAGGSLYFLDKNYDPLPDVYIRCENAEHRELIGLIFDGVHPILIRKGILRIKS